MSSALTEKLFPVKFNDLFWPWEEWAGNGKSLFNREWPVLSVPAANISENKTSYHLSLAVPGLKKEDIRIDIDGDLLTVSAEKKEPKEKRDEQYSRKEFCYASFSRSFNLPAEVIKDKIDAQYKNGVLHITLPKDAHTAKSSGKRINIK